MRQEDLRLVVERSRSIRERLLASAPPTEAASPTTQDRLRRWCEAAAGGDPSRFRRGLARRGLRIADARRAVSERTCGGDGALPAWASTLEELIEEARAAELADPEPAGGPPSAGPSGPGEALPFQELLATFLAVARRRLRARPEVTRALEGGAATAQALEDLERPLLRRFAGLAGPALYAEFCRTRPVGQSLLGVFVQGDGPPGRAGYLSFLRRLAADGLPSFFREYPVLGRLLAESVLAFAETMAEFLGRLHSDRAALAAAFGDRGGLGPAIAFRPALSDSHDSGRSVIAVQLGGGGVVYYKPRAIDLEVAYGRFLSWCDQVDPVLHAPRMLPRGAYGWMEGTRQLSCESEAEVERYYEAAGKLLCVLDLLRATDAHFENLVAHGPHPVLVDAETLLVPEAGLVPDGHAPLVDTELSGSVLRTALLPIPQLDASGASFDVSGLGSIRPQRGGGRTARWRAVNSDAMCLVYEDAESTVGANVVLRRGQAQAVQEHAEALVLGFRRMHRFLSSRRRELLSPSGPLAAFRAQRSRFIFRPTRTYQKILLRSLAPECLRSGVERSLAVELASRAFFSGVRRRFWPLLEWELSALEQCDVPRFEALSDDDALVVGERRIVEHFFRQTGWEGLRAHVAGFDRRHEETQIAIIRSTLEAAAPPPSEAGPREVAPAEAGAEPRVDEGAYLEAARAIADALLERALVLRDGSLAWLGQRPSGAPGAFVLSPTGDSLYEGRCGIALFLAAAGALTGQGRYREAAAQALAGLKPRARLKKLPPGELGLGGTLGLGGALYALSLAGRLLDDPSPAALATELVGLVPPAAARDSALDVLGGAAGALLGLLAVHEASGDPAALAAATACGERLLSCAEGSAGGLSWRTLDGRALTGMAHGAAGIVFALLRLERATGDARYGKAARAGLVWERQAYSPAIRNWPDLRATLPADAEGGAMLGWCHGAPGVGLARLATLAALDDEEVHREIDIALETTLRGRVIPDHLCCGTLGHVELLLEAAARLRRPELREVAAARAARVVRGARPGGYQLFDRGPRDTLFPGFFRGTAGIGYELLRLVHASLPSVLILDGRVAPG